MHKPALKNRWFITSMLTTAECSDRHGCCADVNNILNAQIFSLFPPIKTGNPYTTKNSLPHGYALSSFIWSAMAVPVETVVTYTRRSEVTVSWKAILLYKSLSMQKNHILRICFPFEWCCSRQHSYACFSVRSLVIVATMSGTLAFHN